MVSAKPWRSAVVGAGLLPCTALAACGSGGALASSADAGPASHGSGSFGGSSADGASQFTVAATASATAICAGQCVDLTAQASGGVAPYTYAWGGGPASADGSTHVCPDATTTYSVVAQDASGARGELAQAAATATGSITVTVGTTCAVASSDAGLTAAGEDAGPGSQVCLTQWAQPPYLTVLAVQMAMDAAGDTFLVVDYVGSPSNGNPALNLGSPSPAYPAGFAVAKLDASCHLQWVREFGGAAGGVQTYAVRTDAASEVTVLGSFTGSADLGSGTVSTPSTSTTGGFLLRLDASGGTLFSKTFLTGQMNAMNVYDLAVTPDGVSTIALSAATDADFGSGPDLASPLGARPFYLVQFDPKGKLAYRKVVSSIDGSLAEILSLGTNASGSLWAYGDSLPPMGGTAQPVVAQLTASASENWKLMPASFATFLAWSVSVGPSGQSVVWGQREAVALWAFSPTGAALWTTTVVPTTISDGGTFFGGAIALDNSDNVTVAFHFGGTIQNGAQPPLASAGGWDIGFQQVDAKGNVGAQGRFGGPDNESLGGVGVDPSGNVVLAGFTEPADGATGAAAKSGVFVVKIHP